MRINPDRMETQWISNVVNSKMITFEEKGDNSLYIIWWGHINNFGLPIYSLF